MNQVFIDYLIRRLLRGGTLGQILSKSSDKQFDMEWVDPDTVITGSGGSKSYSFFVGS